MMRSRRRSGVAPVLATLLMIAVAVAMSVIIFMWSQGFLSNTSNSVGGQQGSQNQAAQSSITIEAIEISGKAATVYVRNVGSVQVLLGVGTAQGISGNSGFVSSTSTTSTPATNSFTLIKGGGSSMWFSLGGLVSGDTINFKVSTSTGTFAQASATAP